MSDIRTLPRYAFSFIIRVINQAVTAFSARRRALLMTAFHPVTPGHEQPDADERAAFIITRRHHASPPFLRPTSFTPHASPLYRQGAASLSPPLAASALVVFSRSRRVLYFSRWLLSLHICLIIA